MFVLSDLILVLDFFGNFLLLVMVMQDILVGLLVFPAIQHPTVVSERHSGYFCFIVPVEFLFSD